jgi:hypothetical protein
VKNAKMDISNGQIVKSVNAMKRVPKVSLVTIKVEIVFARITLLDPNVQNAKRIIINSQIVMPVCVRKRAQ